MPYTIKKSNGQTLTIVEDGTVDTTTNLNLPGKNYAGYGSSLNESLIYLLENFSNSVEPSKKITGQLWFDSIAKKIKVYDGAKFRSLGSIEYGTSAPANQITGDQWFNTTTNQLFVWNGTAHKLIGPLQVGSNTSQLLSKKLLDDGGNTETVLQAVVGNTVVAIFSETEFTLGPNSPITGYSHIFKGINLPSTTDYPNIQFAGVAASAKNLLVSGTPISADQFVQNSSDETQTMNSSLYVRVAPSVDSNGNFTNRQGIFVGVNQDLYLSASSGVGYITNTSGDTLTMSVQSSGATKKVFSVQPLLVVPSTDNTIDLGATGTKWKSIYASNFFADTSNANNAFNGRINGTRVNASEGFFGVLTGNVKGNVVKDVQGTTRTILDVTGSDAVFNGNTIGLHNGSVINADIQDETQRRAVDMITEPGTTIFRGRIDGNAGTSTAIKVGSTLYAGLTSTLNPTLYRNTVALRDADGRISALEFDGVATKAASINAPVGPGGTTIACTPSVTSDPYTIVIRNSLGNIDAGRIDGTAGNSEKLNNASDSTQPLPNTIAKRDSSGDLHANYFQGIAVQANYADLAEKYLADAEYEIGTVLMIGGDAEVTASKWGKRAIGAVSASPAYLMNKDLEGGTIVALKGRIPVKVIGVIKKGDELIASDNGCAVMSVPHASGVFAIALESNSDTGVKLVECLVL